jgi:hypothetical protein
MPAGAPPVDVTGINYGLARRLAPDPDQALPLVRAEPAGGEALATPAWVTLLAGPIVDHNGHTVPDGTAVTFYAEYDGGIYLAPLSAETTGGRAQVTFDLQAGGEVHFRAESGEASRSQVVSLVVESSTTATPPASATVPATATSPPTVVPTATQPPTATPAPTAAAGPGEGMSPPAGGTQVGVQDLLLAGAGLLLGVVAGYPLLGHVRRRRSAVVRWLLLAATAGLAVYIVYALGWLRPAAWGLVPEAWVGAVLVATVAVAALLPLAVVREGRGHGTE